MDRKLGGLIAAAFCFAAMSAHAQVKETVDRFTGTKEITYSSASTRIGTPRLLASLATKDAGTTGRLMIMLSSLTDRRSGTAWKYLRCHQVAWLLDDVPLDLGEAHHEGHVVRGGVIETISQAITPAQLQAVGNASRAEYRICTDVYSLSGTDIAALRDMASRHLINGPTPSKAAQLGHQVQHEAPPTAPNPKTDCVSCGSIGKDF